MLFEHPVAMLTNEEVRDVLLKADLALSFTCHVVLAMLPTFPASP